MSPDGSTRTINDVRFRVAAVRAESVVKKPAAREKLATQLMEVVGSTPQQFRAQIDGEIARWAPVIKAADVKVN